MDGTVDAAAAALAEDGGAGLMGGAADLFEKGGIALWIIAGLSVLMVATLLWKVWRMAAAGTWRRDRAERALHAWAIHDDVTARQVARAGRDVRARLVTAAIEALATPGLSEARAREETTRVAKGLLADARSGVRVLDLIATTAPLLGLFGTVLGMIAAFRELQAAGGAADPSQLAGGIWEALLTTAAGMAVAIPAAMAQTWFESQFDRLRRDMEDIATRIFTRPPRPAPEARPEAALDAARRAAE